MKAVRIAVVSLLLMVVVLGLPAPAQAASTIDVWYGLNQDLALPGAPQPWFDIPGNVSGAASLSYRLNGGASVPLTIGPDGRRLQNAGDFNVDLAVSTLNSGPNTVEIKANDGTTVTVTVNYTPPGGSWPIPSTIDWSDYSAGCVVGQPCGNINDAAHVVDGRWQLTAAGVRTLGTGYDRAIAVGDTNWTEYEVTAPVTVHSLNNDPQQGIAGGVGFLVGWRGHSDNPVDCGQPNCGWLPLGTIGYYRTNGLLQLFDEGGDLDSTPKVLVEGETYIFKLQVKSSPNANPGNVFSFKVWDTDDPEPPGWEISGQETEPGVPHNGSVLLLSHYDDVTFGDITFCPVGGCPAAGPVAVDDGKLVADLGSIDIDVLANDLSGDAALDRSTVTVVDDPTFGTTSTDPVTGVITYTHTDTGSTPDAFTYTVADTDGLVSNEAQVTVLKRNSALESDDFNAPALDDRWTWVPVDVGTSYALVGAGTGDAHLAISTGTTAHDQFVPTGPNVIDEAPRVMQPLVANIAFEIEAKFNAEPTGGFNDQGVLVEQDPSRWLRFDTYHTGSQLRAFVGDTNGTTQTRIDVPIPTGSGRYLRVRRIGNEFTFEHSADGTIWAVAGTVTSVLTVNTAGIFAANPSGGDFTAEVDYVFSTIAPVDPEDPLPPPGELTPDPVALDFGAVTKGTTSAALEVLLTNTGESDLTITSTSISSDPGDEFSDDFDDAVPLELIPGASTTIEVLFSPTVLGTRSASLDISHDGVNGPILAVPLTGDGTSPAGPLSVDLVLSVPDADGDLVDEVGVLLFDPASWYSVVLRDEVDGSLTAEFPIASAFEPLDVEVTPAGDLAVLLRRISDGQVRVRLIPVSGGGVTDYRMGPAGDVVDLAVLPDGDFAVLGTRVFDGMVRVRVVDAATGDVTIHLFGKSFSGDVLQVTAAGELVVLGTRGVDQQVRVRVLDPTTALPLVFLYGKVFSGDDLALSADGDLAVVGTRSTDSLVRVRVIDQGTAVRSNYYYGTAFSGDDVEMIGGVDPTVLGTRASDGLVRVRVTDSATGLPAANYYIGTQYSGIDLEETSPGWLGVLGQSAVDGSIRVRVLVPGDGRYTIGF